MKEMVYRTITEYLSKPELQNEILIEGNYKEHHFVILNIGKYPTAYVENKQLLPFDLLDDEINCHVLLSWGSVSDIAFWNKQDKRHYIGWDYGHITDYNSFSYNSEQSKKWTTEEVFNEVKDVIEQLINIEKKIKEVN